MTLKELREIYEGSSSKASEINRQLIFTGIAIVWIFREFTNNGHIIPEEFKSIILLFCISLCFDITQYLIRGIMWHVWYYFKRNPKEKEEDILVEEPEWINSIPDSFWYAKFIPTILAYIHLSNYLQITSINAKLLATLSGWNMLYVVGIIYGILMLWYVITEKIAEGKGDGGNSTIICLCVRISIALFALLVCMIKILLR